MGLDEMNVIDDLTLNISADEDTCRKLQPVLYDFARNTLAELLDRVLAEVGIDEPMEIESLTVDVGEVSADYTLEQFAEKLPEALRKSLSRAVFKKRSSGTVNMLSETYRRMLPMEESVNIEKLFDGYAEEWLRLHPYEKFSSMALSEYIIKIMMGKFPNLDARQIAYSVYQKVKQMDAPMARKEAPREAANEVHDAGIVLLTPYIPMLFNRLGCVVGNMFVSEGNRLLGLALLRYAVFGDYKIPPCQSFMMNLLCNFEGSYSPKELPEVSNEQKKMVNGLLSAVVQNWGALGSTSADGLRSSFLVRAGRIEDGENGLVLKVATSAYDMLLEKLPWGYSTVKLPWMKSKIDVKWR